MISVSMILLFLIKCIHRVTKNSNETLITTIKKHGENILTTYRQYEKLKLKLCRVEQAIEFLRICLLYNVHPKFIKFKPYNEKLRKTKKYKDQVREMLFDEYRTQYKLSNKLKSTLKNLELNLRNEISIVLWTRIDYYLKDLINRETKLIKERHKKKFISLKIPVDSNGFNNKLVYNYSYRNLTDDEENLLSKGWKYALTLNKINTLNAKTDLEYLYTCLQNNKLIDSPDKINKIKSCFNEFGNKINIKMKNEIPNISLEERRAIESLSNDKLLVISKVDKGNAIVVLNREDYLMKAYEILCDNRAFKKLQCNPTEQREQNFIKFLLKLKKEKMINDKDYKMIRPKTGSRTPEAYFLIKVHKQNLPVRPIISSYDAYNYNASN